MKTLFTFALAGLLATSSFASVENEDLMELSNVQAKYKKINVLLKDGIGKARVSILDESGKLLHRRNVQVKNGDIVLPYDLTELPCASYQVKISTEEEEVSYSVETFEKLKKSHEYPLMAYGSMVDDQTINLAVIGLNKPGVDVKIKTEKGNKTLYQEMINQPEGFKKDFKLEGVTPSEVYFEVSDSQGRTRIIHF